MLTLEELGIKHTHVFHGSTKEQEIMLDVLKEIGKGKRHPDREGWEAYWEMFDAPTPPTYLNRSGVFRYQGNYVIAEPDTELRFSIALKRKLFAKHLADVESLAEFGCGNGYNLQQYHEMFPKVKLHAYDWSPAALSVAGKVPNVVDARVFDMTLSRWPSTLNKDFWLGGFGMLTYGAMEQLDESYRHFLRFLASVKPKIVVHVEPAIELYKDTLFDQLAILYHKSRGYLGRYIAEVEKVGTVIEKCRTGFGNHLNEGYSVVVWVPK
jgi:hypothetical protein